MKKSKNICSRELPIPVNTNCQLLTGMFTSSFFGVTRVMFGKLQGHYTLKGKRDAIVLRNTNTHALQEIQLHG